MVSEARSAVVHPNSKAKLLTVIGLTTMHAVLYYIYVVPNLHISKNDFTKLNAKIVASIYISKFSY